MLLVCVCIIFCSFPLSVESGQEVPASPQLDSDLSFSLHGSDAFITPNKAMVRLITRLYLLICLFSEQLSLRFWSMSTVGVKPRSVFHGCHWEHAAPLLSCGKVHMYTCT